MGCERSDLACGASAAAVALLALTAVTLLDGVTFAYVVLEAWNDGLSLRTSLRDACFSLSETDYPFWRLIVHSLRGRVPPAVLASDDHTTAVCKTALHVKPIEHDGSPWLVHDTADPVPTEARMEAFIEVCRDVYGALDPVGRHRAVLENFTAQPGSPVEVPNVTAPTYYAPMSEKEHLQRRKRRYETASSRPDLRGRRQRAAGLQPERHRSALSRNPLQPVEVEVIHHGKVLEALRDGQVAVFDAGQLLPKELFNLTIAKIAAMHGESAKQIPVYRLHGAGRMFAWQSLWEMGQRFEALKAAGKLYHGNTVPLPSFPEALFPKPPTARWLLALRSLLMALDPRRMGDPEEELHNMRKLLTKLNVNARRLPALPAFDLKLLLGNPAWLERVWSLLWGGADSGSWHFDEPDNLLIALNGEMTVAVFDPADTNLISGIKHEHRTFPGGLDLRDFDPDKTSKAFLERNLWLRRFPYVRVHLTPGMGVTVPSRAYHSIWMEDAERLLLNAFMIPHFGAVPEGLAARQHFFGPALQNELYLALLHLKWSSLIRLWDTRRIGGFFELIKLEMF